MNELLYEYEGSLYPDYLKRGNATRFILPIASHFCIGRGLDVGCGKWPMAGAIPIDLDRGGDAMDLPKAEDGWNFIYSSHCLEHLVDPIGALEHWRDCLKVGGVLFLYLPHMAMRYWHTTRNRKHLHEWEPSQMARIVRDLGFRDVIHSERDLAWSFAVVGFRDG